MFKHLKLAVLAGLLATGFTACSDDENILPPNPQPSTPAVTGAYAVIQGNQWGGVPGSMDELDFAKKTVASGAFYAANGQALGDTPQAGVRYGSKIYLPVFGSNVLWVLDAQTLKIKAQIQSAAPEAVCGAGGYVYVASNEGYVSRVDTLTLTADAKKIEVGPNPVGLAATQGKVYVSISDGYNSANGYVNGKKVVAIDTESYSKAGETPVGLNPGRIFANSTGELFVVCNGNYADILPKIQKIAADGTVSDFCDGSLLTLQNDTLYVIDLQADYMNNTAKVSVKRYLTLTGESDGFAFDAAHLPAMPTAIDVNPTNGNIFVCSDKGPMDYDKTGYVYEYRNDGTFVNRYEVGIHPFGVVFK